MTQSGHSILWTFVAKGLTLVSRTSGAKSAVKRREFIVLAGGTMATWSLGARAQQPAGRVYRVGYLAFGSREQQTHLTKAFQEGLRLGYGVGENVIIEYRFADGRRSGCRRLPQTWSGSAWTSSSPETIEHGCGDEGDHDHPDCHDQQFRSGQCRSCRQSGAPGRERHRDQLGHGDEINGKRLELLKEALPNLSRVGILGIRTLRPIRAG